jgi:opacity protein-like surface antigen
MKKHIFIATVALTGLVSLTSRAQVKLNTIGVGVSYWERSYDGVDERSFLGNYDGNKGFDQGGFMPHLSAELGIFGGLGIDGRVGVWTGKFESETRFTGGRVIAEEIKQTIIPVSLGLVYRFDNLFEESWNIFAGAGLNRYFIQNKVSRTVTGGEVANTSDSFSGNDYGANIKAGVEYMFSETLGLALEGRYNTGSYEQTFQAAGDGPVQNYEVALKGIEASFSLRYRFKNETNTPDTNPE